MSRTILAVDNIHPAARDRVSQYHKRCVDEVQAAIGKNDVVVVGMKQNPHPRRARRALEAKGIPYEYLEYGSYLGEWKPRLALKIWSGWPTFPMIFVRGTLIGGADELEKLLASGELNDLLGN